MTTKTQFQFEPMSESKFPSDIQGQINHKAEEYRSSFDLSEKIREVAKSLVGARVEGDYIVMELSDGEFPIDIDTLVSYNVLAEKKVLKDVDPEEYIRQTIRL